VQKEVEQWFLRITKYADELIWPENSDIDWPKQVKEGQNNWIGRSEGMLLRFGDIEVFTTRPDTTDGATFMVVAPEHPFAQSIKSKEVQNYISRRPGKPRWSEKKTAVSRAYLAVAM